MPKRKFRRDWKIEGTRYANQLWHCPEYRYWDERDASKQELAGLAARVYRTRIENAYQDLRSHPRSKKAVERIRDNARALGSIGLWLLENQI